MPQAVHAIKNGMLANKDSGNDIAKNTNIEKAKNSMPRKNITVNHSIFFISHSPLFFQ